MQTIKDQWNFASSPPGKNDLHNSVLFQAHVNQVMYENLLEEEEESEKDISTVGDYHEVRGDSMGGASGRGIDEFLTMTAKEYFASASQIILIYDESWDISDMLVKLETYASKSLVTYFFPLDKEIGKRIKTKPPDHILHKSLPKGTAFIVFVKDEIGFANILDITTKYPWWNSRARMVILVKEKSLEPTRGILHALEAEKIFNGVVVTEVSGREIKNAMGLGGLDDLDEEINSASLQIAALDPYPGPYQQKHVFVARWSGSKFTARTRPIFQEKIDNLRGHKLKAIVFEFPPLVMWQEVKPKKFAYTGLEVKIFHELSNYINFTYDIYELKGSERWGQDLGDGDWNGLIGEVSKSKADIGFANVFLLDGREKVVDVTVPYDQDRGCFAVPRPEALQHWLGLILPFSWEVWACLISMAIVSGPMFSLITRPIRIDKSISIAGGIYYALGAMVSVQKAPKARSSSLRSFIISWLIFCWLACVLYRVALIVSLTVGPKDFTINTLKQLARSGLKWGGFEEVLRTFANSTDRTDKKLIKRFRPIDDVWRALDRVANKADFAVMDSSKLLNYAAKGLYFNGFSSAIHVTRECPTSYNVGFVLPIGSPFYERINHLIHLMQNAGLIHYWLDQIQYHALLTNPSKKKGMRREKGLTIGHLKLLL
ncbi:unnamed protein product, partial [Allacma fusca]